MDKPRKEIQVWKIPVRKSLPFLMTHFQSVLSQQEKGKAKLFFQEKDRANYLLRRIVIRLLVAKELGCIPEEIVFVEGKNKKPEIAHPPTSLRFSISHSGDCILIGIGYASLGIDVEGINPTFQFQDLSHHYFTQEEQDFIFQDKDKEKEIEAFFLLWTRKEAYLKFTGEGLLGDLMNMPNLIEPQDSSFKVISPKLDPDYAFSLVCQADVSSIKYLEFVPNEVPYFFSSLTF